MLKGTWIKYDKMPTSSESLAVVGSAGLRSIGKLVIDTLVRKINPEPLAELYSFHFPVIYQTTPSYVPHPKLPGIGGIKIESGKADLPKVQFYYSASPPLIITRGYHANFDGQYEVAEKVLEFYNEVQVRRMIVVAGYGSKTTEICCAATSKRIIEEIREKYGIEVGYEGPFYGFSGIIFGLARLRRIEALCLFAGTEPIPEDPEQPDEQASKNLLDKLVQILNLKLDDTK